MIWKKKKKISHKSAKMTLGKYYCDHCDKQFQDTPLARKRPLQGIQHLRAKALWYDSFNETNQAYPNGFPKGICSRFVKTGFCPFGDSCKYFHPKNSNAHNTVNQGDIVSDSMGMSWGNLPLSLKPPEGGYLPFPFVDWG